MLQAEIPTAETQSLSPSILIAWGSSTGYTAAVAGSLYSRLADIVEAAVDIGTTSVEELTSFDVLILGVSTWFVGELQEDWQDCLEELAGVDLSGKIVAIFGCGDAHGYPDNYQDAIGHLWRHLEVSGAQLIGRWPTKGYDFLDSQALTEDGDHFVGLAIDEHNEPNLTEDRLDRWAHQLRQELDLLIGGSPARVSLWVN